MRSYIGNLPAERLSLINSLLRQDGVSVREVAAMTFETCAGKRSARAWEAAVYRWKEGGMHLKVVRENNLLCDRFAISDLTIRALEAALADDEKSPNLALLNVLKSSKPITTSILDKLTGDIDERIKQSGQEPPNTLLRDPNRIYS
jgi:hypothetical protein